MNNVLIRSLTGIVFISTILIPLFYSDIITTVVFGLFMSIGLIEFYKLFKYVDPVGVSWKTGLLYGIIAYGISSLVLFKLLPQVALIVLLPTLLSIITLELWRKKKSALINVSVFVFGIVYITIPFILMVLIITMDNNAFPVLAGMFILTWTNDTFAYLSGRILGKTKLFERVSPNKTWEGTIGGVVSTLIVGIGIAHFFAPEHLLFWVISALIIAPCAVFGDLIESLFKRNVKVKDTGTIMPGHGGILDRFDAIFFVVPFFLTWVIIYVFFG
ncbi:MAG: phosphatidate cytidylyltransferase [Crocinitomicaceae bacterium]|nr:phosphatidate cytidylyltransferase [Crocinitomicaceae bacterium]MDG1776396.1 phosphatidate cytidylyltransferase [Crocinitomicaceae bacterium]